MGIGDWGLGIGDWGLGPIPNPQFFYLFNIFLFIYLRIKLISNIKKRKINFFLIFIFNFNIINV